jgi:parallel beta-helix repeat protein
MRVKRLLISLLTATVLAALVAVAPAQAAGPKPVTCGDTIKRHGDYVLAGDCIGVGITITASGVHLNLDGHTVDGSRGPGSGILISGASHVYVEGPGTITNFIDGVRIEGGGKNRIKGVSTTSNVNGITVWNATGVHLDANDASYNDAFGILIHGGGKHRLSHNQASFNGPGGIRLEGSSDNHITGNQADVNHSTGISADSSSTDNHIDHNQTNANFYGIELQAGSTGNHVDGNTSFGNVPPGDLVDDNPDCDSNRWNGNHFDNANQPCIS